MRRDQFEIGLEREYALYASNDGAIACLLAGDRLLAEFHALVDGDSTWQRMQADGWRVAPEYSKCLVEIASPPAPRGGWSELLAGFGYLEDRLAGAAERLQRQSTFDRIECTADFSVRTDRFVVWSGAAVTTFAELLLDGAHDNWLLGSPDDVPPCFAGSAPELLYAAFTSTNATVHPPMRGELEAAPLADYCSRVLRAARQIEVASPQRHPLLRGGRVAVPPDPDLSIRDALIRWGDPTAASYSCRTRVVENTMLFELRCFHSGLSLANLAPLLDAAERLLL